MSFSKRHALLLLGSTCIGGTAALLAGCQPTPTPSSSAANTYQAPYHATGYTGGGNRGSGSSAGGGGSSSGSSSSGSSSSGSSSSGSSSGSSSSGSSSSGSSSSGSSSSSGGGWNGSDRRLKQKVVRIGTSGKGVPLYRFQYIWGGPHYVGVMAQDLFLSNPDAVATDAHGFFKVNYDRLGLPFETWKDHKRRRARSRRSDVLAADA